MSFPTNSIEFCPVRANIDWSQVQYSDYPNQEVQVADYSKVEYFQPSDSDEEQSDETGQNGNGQSRCFFPLPFPLFPRNFLRLNTHADIHVDGHSAEGGNVSGGDGLASPTSPVDGTAPISSKTAKNKAKKAKQKAKEKAKKAAAALSGESTPLETPMTPLSPVSPTGQLGEGEQAATPKSKNKKKKKKSKSKNSLDSAPTTPPPELASTEQSSIQQPESSIQEPQSSVHEPEAAPEPVQESVPEPTAASEPAPVPEPAKDVTEDAPASPAVAAPAVDPEQPDQSSSIAVEPEAALEPVSEPVSESIAASEPPPAAELVKDVTEDTPAPPAEVPKAVEPQESSSIAVELSSDPSMSQPAPEQTQTDGDGSSPAEISSSIAAVEEKQEAAPEAAPEPAGAPEPVVKPIEPIEATEEPVEAKEEVQEVKEDATAATIISDNPSPTAEEQISSVGLQQPVQDSPSPNVKDEAVLAPQEVSEAPKEILASEVQGDASALSDEPIQPSGSSQVGDTQDQVVPSTSETIEVAKEPEVVQSHDPSKISGDVVESQELDGGITSKEEVPAAVEEVKEADITASDSTKDLQETSPPEHDVSGENTEQAAAPTSENTEQPLESIEQPSEAPVHQDQPVNTESEQAAPISSGEAESASVEQIPQAAPLSTSQPQPTDSLTQDSKPEIAETTPEATEEPSVSVAHNDDSVSTENAPVPELAGLESKESSQDAQLQLPNSDQKDDSSPAQVERAVSPAPIEPSATVEEPTEDSSAQKSEAVQEESAESPGPVTADAQQSVAEESARGEGVSQDDDVAKSGLASIDPIVASEPVESVLPESTSTGVEPTTDTSLDNSLPSTAESAPVEAVVESSPTTQESTVPPTAPAEVPSPAEELDSKAEEVPVIDEKPSAVQDTPVEDSSLAEPQIEEAKDAVDVAPASVEEAPSTEDKEAEAPQKGSEEESAPLPADSSVPEPQPELEKAADLPSNNGEPAVEETLESSPLGASDAQEINSGAPAPQSDVLDEKKEQVLPEATSTDSPAVDESSAPIAATIQPVEPEVQAEAKEEAKDEVQDEEKIEPTVEDDKLNVTENEPVQGNDEGTKLEEAIPVPEKETSEVSCWRLRSC